jgi:hypothetical protein
LHASHVLNINGRSHRLRDPDDHLGRQNRPAQRGDHSPTPTSVNPARESSGSLSPGRFECADARRK